MNSNYYDIYLDYNLIWYLLQCTLYYLHVMILIVKIILSSLDQENFLGSIFYRCYKKTVTKY